MSKNIRVNVCHLSGLKRIKTFEPVAQPADKGKGLCGSLFQGERGVTHGANYRSNHKCIDW